MNNAFCTSCASRVPQALTVMDRFQILENSSYSLSGKEIYC